MSSSRAFASLSSTLLARKGGARPAMRSALPGQGEARPHDPLSDLGWNDMGDNDPADTMAVTPLEAVAAVQPAPAPAPSRWEHQAVVAFDPAPAASIARPAEPLLVRKPVAAEVVQLVRDVPAARPVAAAPLTRVTGHGVVRRSRTAAFTLRLDPDRHFRLRTACAAQARSAQAIVTEAVDRFLDALPELEPLGASGAAQRTA